MSITIVGIQVVSKVVGEVFTKVCGNDINDDDDVKCYWTVVFECCSKFIVRVQVIRGYFPLLMR